MGEGRTNGPDEIRRDWGEAPSEIRLGRGQPSARRGDTGGHRAASANEGNLLPPSLGRVPLRDPADRRGSEATRATSLQTRSEVSWREMVVTAAGALL